MIEEALQQLQARWPAERFPLSADEEITAHRLHWFQRFRLRIERWLPVSGRRLRVASTACWEFPIYSQTFVYQELSELVRGGFRLRFLYSKLNPRSFLPEQFSRVWQAKRKLVLHHAVCERDYAYYCERMPEKVRSLVEMICEAARITPDELRNYHHFKQAFAFTRTVEACGPDYLHSYFFYEGTLFTLVASYLLDIPRGVSCYADHMLDDYALKVVPLHIRQCSLVIATSNRIKRELMAIAPTLDPDRIVVKPNAVDCRRFQATVRSAPAKGTPFRLVCVSRIEPKKGLLYLAEAVRLLVDGGHNVSVRILGGVDDNEAGRDYARALDEKIRDLGIGSVLHLEGRRSGAEIQQFLQESHLFLAPFVETESGDKDGIPTALLEGMASGLPAVVTDAGSIVEVVDHGQDGLIVPQRDGKALAEAIASLLNDVGLRQRMGSAAAEKIRRSFDVSVCEKRFHERIRSLTRRQKRNVH
ncbi:MAG: glycosyltransferase family 4 protein [Candidatus Solibacter sp.]